MTTVKESLEQIAVKWEEIHQLQVRIEQSKRNIDSIETHMRNTCQHEWERELKRYAHTCNVCKKCYLEE